MSIKNIVFDLGGVVMNLSFNKTKEAFTALGVKDFDAYFTQYHAAPMFKQLERGNYENSKFYDSLRHIAGIDADNDEIDAAWNAMLLDFPEERVLFLKELAKKYRLFLFSNTNAIHHAAFRNNFFKRYGFDFDSLFEKAYYSHLIGYRKPDPEAFRYVIETSNIDPAETLFLDDTLPNVEAARESGMQAEVVTAEKDMIALVRELL